jgi:hypothetical protein
MYHITGTGRMTVTVTVETLEQRLSTNSIIWSQIVMLIFVVRTICFVFYAVAHPTQSNYPAPLTSLFHKPATVT